MRSEFPWTGSKRRRRLRSSGCMMSGDELGTRRSPERRAYFWGFWRKKANFAVPLPNSIRVVRKILDLYVLVRIQVGQQVTPRLARGIFLAGSEASLLA